MLTSASLEHMTVLPTLLPAQIRTEHTAVLVILDTKGMEKQNVKCRRQVDATAIFKIKKLKQC